MGIVVSPMKEEDIDGAITTIQEAFATDPYNLWVYNDRSKVGSPSSHLSAMVFPKLPLV